MLLDIFFVCAILVYGKADISALYKERKNREVNGVTKITADMSIIEVVEQWPQAARVLMEHGMGCLGCAAAHFENIEQGATAHGIDTESLITALNEAIA